MKIKNFFIKKVKVTTSRQPFSYLFVRCFELQYWRLFIGLVGWLRPQKVLLCEARVNGLLPDIYDFR